jgi:hypothetical protein
MASILDTLADDVTAALTGDLRSSSYWRQETSGRDEFGDPIVSWVSHPCQGVRASYDAMYAAAAGIPIDSVRIEVLAQTLDVTPKKQDAVQIEGAFWSIDEVTIDPATALYTLQAHSIEDPTQ